LFFIELVVGDGALGVWISSFLNRYANRTGFFLSGWLGQIFL